MENNNQKNQITSTHPHTTLPAFKSVQMLLHLHADTMSSTTNKYREMPAVNITLS